MLKAMREKSCGPNFIRLQGKVVYPHIVNNYGFLLERGREKGG